MIEFQLLIVAICAACKLIGELWWHNAQRFIMPVVLGAAISYITHCWWLGLTTLPALGPICLGYDTFRLGDAGDRGFWLFLIALVLGAGPCFTGHMHWYFYVSYFIIAGIWGATTRRIWNVMIAPITGAWLGLIVFLIR